MNRFSLLFAVCTVLICCSDLFARTWTSAVGGYTLEADAVAFNEASVVLKRQNGTLAAVDLAELSEGDRDYVKSKEMGEAMSESIEKVQTWTSKDGVKVRGRVLAFGKKDLTVVRQRGKAVINDVTFADYDPLHQKLLLRILSALESQNLSSEHDLYTWAKGLAGQPKTYPLEGVLMELESGDEIAVPFFLFSSEDLKVLQPGWEAWKEAHEDEMAQNRESLMMQAEAMNYQQQQQQRDRQQQQIEYLRLNLLAAATGVTSIWEVGLQAPGLYGRRASVMVTAPDSDQATRMALAQHRGCRVIGVRKASR